MKSNPNPNPFDEALTLEPLAEGRYQGHTHPAFANMVGPYGGVSAAQVLQAVLLHPQRLGDPVSLTVNFCAALADGPFQVRAKPVRTNRSTQHWTVSVCQGDDPVLTATALTALRRDTWSAEEHTAPAVPAPQAVPQRSGAMRVEWLQRYEMRLLDQALPSVWDGSDQGHSRTRLWVRDQPPRPLDFASLTALADVFTPRIWHRRARLVPLGTVSLTVYYHASAAQLAATGEGYLLGQAQGQGFGRGYFDQSAQLWNEGGTLLATTHQVVYFKE
ncbi:acyl-CoA thioesterase [Hydrogenophaga sp.]|uniref:acyl-CoA thioesterase n=1 Tax=Hydrogenophaga sp. TaxID=1904254 RepID=UPI00356267A7